MEDWRKRGGEMHCGELNDFGRDEWRKKEQDHKVIEDGKRNL